ncbi:FimV/HubP family polar landmark protein [Alteromonas sp. H39]|uniref:FimV/HubP family polar landmark protein n=1 Tax=Alteromonas sp. H39 TaxID=3389876 RepID=UPI0039E09EFC
MKLHLSGLLLLTILVSVFPTVVDAQERATQLRGPKDATSQFSGNTYGPIDAKDTLWRIAERYRQNKDLSIYQVMIAIYELNPDAFEEGNLNLLVDGATLQLPSEQYIARIDAERARVRAEQDDKSFAQALEDPDPKKNIKPPVPLASQEDLTQTKSAIEQQINQLDSQQSRQFDELRQQFAESITNVQTLLDNNSKLYERIERVNDDLQNLRAQLEGDVKSQIDNQVELQQQLLAMMEEEKRQRLAEKESSITNMLTSPMAMIIGSGVITLLLVGGLVAWLLGRNKDAPAPVAAAPEPVKDVAPAPTDDLDDLASVISDDLDDSAELSDDELFNDDDLLDDVLSNELEEALDDELENFADLDDDMLVPDSDEDDSFEEGADELDQDDLDSLFDEEDLTDTDAESDLERDELGGIDLASEDDADLGEDLDEELPSEDVSADDIDDLLASAGQAEEVDEEDEFEVSVTDNSVSGDQDGGADDPTEDKEVSAIPVTPVADEEEKPEISIDELLEEDSEEESLAATLGMDDDTVNEEMLEKLDKEIHDQNQQLDRLTDNIIGEIEQLEMMGGLIEEDDEEVDAADEEDMLTSAKPSPQAIQDLDSITDDLEEIDIADMENAEEFNDPLSDELISELQAEDQAQQPDNVQLDVMDSLSEGNAPDSDDVDDSFDIAEDIDDPLGDELLAELEQEDSASSSELDALSDELLSELETQPDPDSDAEDTDQSDASGKDNDSDAIEQTESDDEIDDPLTDELLAELESDQEEDDHGLDDKSGSEAEQRRSDENVSASEDDNDNLDIDAILDQADEKNGDDTSAVLDTSDSADDTDGSDDPPTQDLQAPDSEKSAQEPARVVDDEDITTVSDETLQPQADENAAREEPDDDVSEAATQTPDEPDTDSEDDSVVSEDAGTLSSDDEESDTGEPQVAADENVESDTEQHDSEIPELPEDSEAVASTDPLEEALDAFDKQMMDDIPAFGETSTSEFQDADHEPDTDGDDFDDSLLDDAYDDVDKFELEQEEDGVEVASDSERDINELEDVPGLDDWLSGSKENSDDEILDDLESTEFDELLNAIDADKQDDAQKTFELDNPDLDLDALLSDSDDTTDPLADADDISDGKEDDSEDYLDIESLMDESDEEQNSDIDDMPLDLDVSLADFTGVGDSDEAIDIDKDAGQSANLDLARVYMEMDDMDAAKELLAEVVEKGSADQQEEAAALLKSIN